MEARTWLYSMAVRTIATAAETALGVIGASAAMGDVNWALVASSAGLSAIVTVLRCMAGLPEVTKNDSDAGK